MAETTYILAFAVLKEKLNSMFKPENVVTSTPPLPAVRKREGKKVEDVVNKSSLPVIDKSAAVESLQIKEVVCVAVEENHESNKVVWDCIHCDHSTNNHDVSGQEEGRVIKMGFGNGQ